MFLWGWILGRKTDNRNAVNCRNWHYHIFLKITIGEIDECKKDISECASKKEINDCKKDIAGIKEDYITKKETLNKRISAGNFVENNGSVLRTINILETKYNRLKNIRYVLGNIENSVNYLYEAGYLHLRHFESHTETTLVDTDFDMLEGKLTAKGIQLLAGGD